MSAGDGSRDEFYVGYLPAAPPRLGRFLRLQVLLLLLLAAAVAALVAARQRPFDPGVFEFGSPRTLEGTLRERPHPALEIRGPGGDVARLWLVGFGKRGAGAEVAGFDGRRVRLEGTLIHREGETMVEIVPGSLAGLDEPVNEAGGAGAAAIEDLGAVELVGEIVDSKCYLGVMKPGRGKPHRACAALCLRGGVPPVLVTEAPDGERRHLLLVGEDGAPLPAPALELVALPVRVTGRLERRGEDLVLLVSDIVRVG